MAQDILNVPVGWVMVPAPWRVDAPPKADAQKWLMTLTGIADINFKGNSAAAWRHETFRLHLDWRSPVSWAYGRTPPKDKSLEFVAEQWAPFATINSVYDVAQSIDAGYAVDSCTPMLVGRNFDGLEVVVGVRDTDAYLYKIGFQVTVLGKIVLEDFPV